jgi:hypothetical protein
MAHDRGCEITEIQPHTVTIERMERNSILLVQQSNLCGLYNRKDFEVVVLVIDFGGEPYANTSIACLAAQQSGACLLRSFSYRLRGPRPDTAQR